MTKQKNDRFLAAALALVLIASGCTKIRPAQWADGEGDGVFSKSLFSSQVTITLGGSQTLDSSAKLPVAEVQGPEELKALFADLSVYGRPGESYPVSFRLDQKFVTAYKIVADPSELSPQEMFISRLDHGSRLVPIFQYAITAYGQVVRSKNDLNEETRKLRLRATNFAEADTIQIVPFASARADLAPEDPDQAKRIFVKDRIDGKIFSQAELLDLLQIRVGTPGKYVARIDDAKNSLRLDRVTSLAELEQENIKQADALRAADKSGIPNPEIRHCSAELSSQLGQSDCVLLLRYEVPITHERAHLKTVDASFDIQSTSIRYDDIGKVASDLVKIEKFTPPIEYNRTGKVAYDPTEMLPVAQYSGKEYLFRRTLTDSPNGFDYIFAGLSGNLEIVRFQFDKDRVRVVRSDALLPSTGANDLDKEVLMSIRARYYCDEYTDSRGNPIATPETVPCTPGDKGAYAVVDWRDNEIPRVSSPMDYFALDGCLTDTGDSEVSDVAFKGNAFSFTLTSHLAATGCLNFANTDEIGGSVESQYAFRERISFEEYTPKNGEKPLLSVPYHAQKDMGFGLFTYRRIEPNANGNVGREGTEKPLAGIWDIQGGKQVTYVLGGLPASGRLRDQVIQATRDVIKDMNAAFRKALAGTPMERKDGPEGDVVVLKVEGVDAPNSNLGDLGTNHIWFVQKATSSGVIGLSSASANPRSGINEAANVMIYGGNILSEVESLRRLDQARKEYAEDMTPLKADDSAGSADSTGNGALRSGSLLTGKPGPARAMSLPSDVSQSIQGARARLQTTGSRFHLLRPDDIAELRENSKYLFLYQALQDGIKSGSLSDPRKMGALVNEKYADVLSEIDPPAHAQALDQQSYAAFRAQNRHEQAIARLVDRMRKQNLCVYEADPSRMASLLTDQDLSKADDIDYLIAIYKPTLAHELGHSMGLRHNFIGSFDRANFKFGASDTSKRDYSSIMDYLTDDHVTYDGLGPQDVAALRAAYAGLVELSPEGLDKLAKIGDSKLLVSGKYIRLDDYRRALGLSSWLDFNEQVESRIPLKKYLFCSDEDAGSYPTCNRFDHGSTPSEIVDSVISDYHTLYSMRNLPGDRLRFNWWDVGSYAGRLLSSFIPVRQFLEETIYQYLAHADQDTINSYAQAALKGMLFFHSIVRTPDAPVILAAVDRPEDRFVDVPTQQGTVVVERKWSEDIGGGENNPRLKVRGIKYDKMIALMLLTQRELGFSRYERESIRISYPEFERIVFNAKDPTQLPTVELLTEILSDDVLPAAGTPKGLLPLSGGNFRVSVSDAMRWYSILGSIVSMDVDGVETTDNLSALFRVRSGFQSPFEGTVVFQPGANRDSENSLRYWASDNALAASQVIGRMDMLTQLDDQRSDLSSEIQKWIGKKTELLMAEQAVETAQAKKPSPDDLAALKQQVADIENEIDGKLQFLPASVGPRTMKEIEPVVMQVIGAAAQLEPAIRQVDQLSDDQRVELELEIDQLQTQIQSVTQEAPILGLVLSSLPTEKIGIQALGILTSSADFEKSRSTMFTNTQLLNRLFYMIHPEYAR